ncbi:hypothetical protein HK102_006403 [Quaeritorhiza haematococci]|nr:hypothetical protein HK102_006403 [Quaeritorhiza haematococci]
MVAQFFRLVSIVPAVLVAWMQSQSTVALPTPQTPTLTPTQIAMQNYEAALAQQASRAAMTAALANAPADMRSAYEAQMQAINEKALAHSQNTS